MVHEPQRIIRGLGNLLDIAEPLEIEPGRYLTFEYIGPHDYFDEGAGQPRERGSKCTSVDAAFTYRTRHGTTELGLVEWKYTEQYMATREPNPGYDKTRVKRYGDTYHAPDGPLRSDLMDVDWMLDEPFYQLMRQQLLAWRLEQDRAEGADHRVLHVLPPENHAYQNSLVRPQQRAHLATQSIKSGRGYCAALTASNTSIRRCSSTWLSPQALPTWIDTHNISNRGSRVLATPRAQRGPELVLAGKPPN